MFGHRRIDLIVNFAYFLPDFAADAYARRLGGARGAAIISPKA